jgi:hypothetical protein
MGIGYEIPPDTRSSAQLLENGPMPRSRLDKDAIRLVADSSDKPKCLVQPTGMSKNPRMSDHAQETTQHKVSHAICLVAVDHRLQPLTVGCMIGRILSMGIHQDVNVRQDH